VVEAAVRGPVSRRSLSPRAAPVLVAGARDQAVHGWWPRLLHADAAAPATGEYIIVKRILEFDI
jgi:hypothetical protein